MSGNGKELSKEQARAALELTTMCMDMLLIHLRGSPASDFGVGVGELHAVLTSAVPIKVETTQLFVDTLVRLGFCEKVGAHGVKLTDEGREAAKGATMRVASECAEQN